MNATVKVKYEAIAVALNTRVDTLKDYTKMYPNAFFFYDSNDFISCTDYAFKVYEEGEMLNNDSLSSWNCISPTYYERNKKYGFTSAIDGLISEDCDVYFLTSRSVRMGMTKTLKDKYNKKLKLVDYAQSNNYILNIYVVVDDD